MGEMSALSLDEVNALIKEQESKPRGGNRSGSTKKDLTEDRTVPGWFKLQHFIGEGTECSVPNHDETPRNHVGPDPSLDPISRNRTTTKIGDLYVCRYCYVEELDKIGE